MKQDSPALLPPGFQDLLPPESDRESYLTARLIETFKSFGYRFVKPPLIEFEKSFTSSHMGQSLSNQTFRLMDPVSHSMMVMRADITPQIVRLAQSRMPNSPRPLRLFYAADSLRVQAGQIRTARQFTQVGCECIGVDTPEADLEICLLAIEGLKTLNLDDITLDFAVPSIVPSILVALDIKQSAFDEVKKYLRQRDIDSLTMLDETQRAALKKILKTIGPAKQGLESLLEIEFLPDQEKEKVIRLKNLVQKLDGELKELEIENVKFTFDPAETLGFDYHTGFAFTLFSKNVQGELGRGGRYTASFSDGAFGEANGSAEQACGFSLYTDSLRRLIAQAGRPDRLWVPKTTPWIEVKKLQAEGWVVMREVSEAPSDETLKQMGYTHKLVNNETQKIS